MVTGRRVGLKGPTLLKPEATHHPGVVLQLRMPHPNSLHLQANKYYYHWTDSWLTFDDS
jgi:hypothetical protein